MRNITQFPTSVINIGDHGFSVQQQALAKPSFSTGLFASPPTGNSNLTFKARQKIPNNSRSRIPSIRRLPSDLYVITSPEPPHMPTASTPLSDVVPKPSLASIWEELNTAPRPTLGRDLRLADEAFTDAEPPTSISIPKLTSAPMLPGVQLVHTTLTNITEPGPTFIDILTENQRRNRHAPAMVSLFNPLREKLPFRAWNHLPFRCNRATLGTFFLPSARFKQRPYSTHSRRECQRVSKGLDYGNINFVDKVKNIRCRTCRQESLRMKVLLQHHFQNISSTFGDQGGAMDLPHTPRLRDLDDFDEFDIDVDDAFADLELILDKRIIVTADV